MITITDKGIDQLLKKFDRLSTKSQMEVQSALNDWADRTAQDAKELVSRNSSDEGNLLNSIKPLYGSGSAAVVATAKYAAYIEFGTRKFAKTYVASLPSDWQQIAAKTKGRAGGTFKEFVESLMGWVKRKGISGRYSIKTRRRVGSKAQREKEDKAAAYAIAKKIMVNGIRPRPFLYPSSNRNLPILINDIKKILIQ